MMWRYPLAYYRALKKIIRHLTYVYREGRALGLPWSQLLKHDLSKFHRFELRYYVEAFELGLKRPWHDAAWEHHWRRNPHHIEYWQDQQGGSDPVVIPECYVREMIADWSAASWVYDNQAPVAGTWTWGAFNLVPRLLQLDYSTPCDQSTRGIAIRLLRQKNMITRSQLTEACTA